MFDSISPTYDRLNHLLSFNIDKMWRRFAAKKLIRPEVRDVLDVCSGTGDLVLSFANRAKEVQSIPRFVSSDFTPSMTRLAKEKFEKRLAAGTVVPLVGDTMRLPFQDFSFDLVSVAFGIRNVSDFRAGLAEMVRVCRDGGEVAVLEFSHPRNPLFAALFKFYFYEVLSRVGGAISGSRAYVYLAKSVSKFPDTDEFQKIMSEISRSQVQAHRLTFGVATLYIAKIKK